MITYSEYFDMYIKDLNNYIKKIEGSIDFIQDKKHYENIKQYILESEKCIKQLKIETNTLPNNSQCIFERINEYNIKLNEYKKILEKMAKKFDNPSDRYKEITEKYIEGTTLLKDSEKRAEDVECMGFTIMSELNTQRNVILKTKHYANETKHEENKIKRLLRKMYRDKITYKCMLMLIIILLVLANIGVLIYKIKK